MAEIESALAAIESGDARLTATTKRTATLTDIYPWCLGTCAEIAAFRGLEPSAKGQ
jgi:hypothetical protein